MRTKICFTVLYGEEEYIIQTFQGEYRDLKCLITDRLFTENFGECGGMGRCGTCLVEIEGLKGEAAELKRNESTTLQRVNNKQQTIRLACQIPIDDSLSNQLIRIVENG